MNDLTGVPVHRNATDLLNRAMDLTTAQRNERRAAVAEAVTELRQDLLELGAQLPHVSPGPDRDRMQETGDAGARRLVELDDWADALRRAQELNYLDN